MTEVHLRSIGRLALGDAADARLTPALARLLRQVLFLSGKVLSVGNRRYAVGLFLWTPFCVSDGNATRGILSGTDVSKCQDCDGRGEWTTLLLDRS